MDYQVISALPSWCHNPLPACLAAPAFCACVLFCMYVCTRCSIFDAKLLVYLPPVSARSCTVHPFVLHRSMIRSRGLQIVLTSSTALVQNDARSRNMLALPGFRRLQDGRWRPLGLEPCHFGTVFLMDALLGCRAGAGTQVQYQDRVCSSAYQSLQHQKLHEMVRTGFAPCLPIRCSSECFTTSPLSVRS